MRRAVFSVHILRGRVQLSQCTSRCEGKVYLALAINSHVGDAGVVLQSLLKAVQLFRRHKELNVRFLIHIPAGQRLWLSILHIYKIRRAVI